MIKLFFRSLCLFAIAMSTLFAAGEPIKIGVSSFDPPFIMQGANKRMYGFDIDSMTYLCKAMNRTCEFRFMDFDELIPAVSNKQIDVAISSITITPERAQQVDFSIPYLLSYSRFLSNQVLNPTQSFSLDMLRGKTIGIDTGTIFEQQLTQMGVKDPVIRQYESIEDSLEALRNGEVDYLLLDNPAAIYWAANSAGVFRTLGEPYMYGLGLGIAVNNTEKQLLTDINAAILQYQASSDYKNNYKEYLSEF